MSIEHTISQEHMASLQALAETNVKIGEAKGTLLKLKSEETEFLKEREKKGEAIIQKMLEDSGALLIEVRSNYSEVRSLCSEASSFAGFLIEMSEDVKRMVDEFHTETTIWDQKVAIKEAEFEKIRQDLKKDRVLLDNDRQSIEDQKKKIAEAWRKVADEQGTLERAIKRLKENRV